MKSGIIIIIMLTFSMIIPSIFTPTVHADPAVMISSYELDPEVLMPGDSAILTLTIINAETTATTTRTTTSTSGSYSSTTTVVETNGVTISNIWIASAYDGEKRVKAKLNYADIGHISAGSSFTICFEIIAEDNISEGLYFPKVHVDVKEDDYEDLSFPIPVRVSNTSVNLIASNVPSKLSISGLTEITLTAINNRESPVDGVSVSPLKIDGFNIMPESIFIGSLDSDSSEDITFTLNPSEVGIKNLTFKITYKNGNNLHSETLTIPLEIIDILDVAPVIYSIPSTISQGKSSRIRLEVFNAKTSEITGVIVTPITDAKISPSQYFIGSMDPDDVFSASFDLYSTGLNIGNYSIGFKVSFKQGEEYFETPIVSSSFGVVAASMNEGDGGIGLILGGILIVVVIAFILFYFLKQKQRRKNK